MLYRAFRKNQNRSQQRVGMTAQLAFPLYNKQKSMLDPKDPKGISFAWFNVRQDLSDNLQPFAGLEHFLGCMYFIEKHCISDLNCDNRPPPSRTVGVSPVRSWSITPAPCTAVVKTNLRECEQAVDFSVQKTCWALPGESQNNSSIKISIDINSNLKKNRNNHNIPQLRTQSSQCHHKNHRIITATA